MLIIKTLKNIGSLLKQLRSKYRERENTNGEIFQEAENVVNVQVLIKKFETKKMFSPIMTLIFLPLDQVIKK